MLFKDIRFAIRALLKAPGFTAVAVVVLGLGIGANSAVFSLVNAALFKAAPGVTRAGRVVGVYSRDRAHADRYRDFSYPNYLDIKANNQVFSDVAAMSLSLVGYREGDQTRRVFAALATSNYFSVFDAPVAKGRPFTPEEEKPGSGVPVVVVSWQYWKTRGFDPRIVGSTVTLNSRPFTVVGVARKGFTASGTIISPDFWFPLGAYEMMATDIFRIGGHTMLADRLNYCLLVYGRLPPGVGIEKTEAALAGLSRQMERAYPADNKDQMLLAHALSRFGISSGPQDDAEATSLSLLLMAMTAVVLAIACLNIANMLLARGVTRRKEVAIRLALGSGRMPIVRQLLVEGMLLSLAGGALGLVLAYWISRLLMATIAPAVPMITISVDATPDVRVVLVTLGFCMFSTLVFALGPAWKLSRTDVVPELKEQGGETGRARRWFSLRHALVVGQVALSLALLTAAGLFIRAAGKAGVAEPGFSLDRSVVVNLDPGVAGYDAATGRETYRRLLERLRTLPGVRSASVASIVPFGDMTISRSVQKMGGEGSGSDEPLGESDLSIGSGTDAPRDRGSSIGANYYIVGADYLKTLGIRLVRGREFTTDEEQSAAGAPKAIIDETLAQKLFAKQNPIGQYIRFTDVERGQSSAGRPAPMEVVGVASPIRHSLFDAVPRPQVYVPFGQHYQGSMFVHLAVAGGGSEAAVMRAVRQELRALDDRIPVLSLRTLKEHRDASVSVWTVKTAAAMFGAIGLAAVFLALVGVYGVKAYLVSRRTREIGIRMSLGATPRGVMWLVLREGLVLTLVGIVLGVALSAATATGLSSMLYQVSALDPLTFAVAPLLLTMASLLACYFPARRAMKVAPLRALRFE